MVLQKSPFAMGIASDYVGQLQLYSKCGLFFYILIARCVCLSQYQYSMSSSTLACTLIGLQLTTTSVVLGFTNGRSSLRLIVFPFLMFLAYSQLLTVPHVQHSIGRTFLGAASVFMTFHYVDVALFSQWAFEAKGPTASMGGLAPASKATRRSSASKPPWVAVKQTLDRLRFGFDISVQSRFPDTKWPVKNIPPFVQEEPSHTPRRLEFLLASMFKCTVFILSLSLISSLGDRSENPILFSSDRIGLFTRLGSVSASELCTRFLGVLGYWVVQYMIIQVVYHAVAMAAVGLHVTEVAAWPPVFGSVDEARSLRQFWG